MSHEYAHLAEFLYEAVFIPEGKVRPGREILNIPEIARYISDFGRENDHCLVAESAGGLLAAVWTRVFSPGERGFGYVDERTPELCMSVLPGYRNGGIGTRLLREMIGKLKQLGYEQVSLSVDLDNFAYRLYQKFGFTVVSVNEGSATMVKLLNRQAISDGSATLAKNLQHVVVSDGSATMVKPPTYVRGQNGQPRHDETSEKQWIATG